MPDSSDLPSSGAVGRPAARKRRSMHDRAVEELGIAIVSGQFPEGVPLPIEAALGEWLGASRTVVREATKVLASKGLLRSRPRIGTVPLPRLSWDVLDPDVLRWMIQHGPRAEVILDVTEVRSIIEPAAARLAAMRRTPDEAAEFAVLIDAMDATVDDEDRYVPADLAFHAAILGSARNATLVRFVSAIEMALGASRHLSVNVPGGPATAMAEHRAVAEAIIRGDPDGAEAAMRALIVLTQAHIVYMLDHGD
jgi:GntR family galactonate operon transcriptional repressor